MTYDFTIQEDIHELQAIVPKKDWFLVLLGLVTLLMEYCALIMALDEWFMPALALHFLSFVLLLTYAQHKTRYRKDDRFVWATTILLPVLGPVAAGGLLIALFWHFVSKEKSLTFREWRESIFPTEHKSIAQTVYERIAFGREELGTNYSVTYLMDVIKLGSDEKKREAIFKISRYYDPSFAPILKRALEDPHNVIRVQAAAAMTKIKNAFFSQSLRLEKLREEWPEHIHVLLELAKHYDSYAFSGVLDEEQQEDNRRLALKYYREYIDRKTAEQKASEEQKKDIHPDLLAARKLYGRLLLRMGKTEEACANFELLREDGFKTPDINLWYSECLFNLNRFATLRQLADENRESPLVKDALKYPDNIRGTVLLWAGPKKEASA